ncbi:MULTISPECIES: hypothetical protein [Cobetia]|jgi:hypothetical protein|uniref:Uncharacterized protein n=1 Tax=Cobetia amphilecti TaxID=1055104 RepID=A0ABT6USZ9_9GAMM|nr:MULTISPECIES: hypothetical protein [Cobetia]MBS4155349.1 hypothetical protein [Cobetia sp. MC34]MCO7233474.1 hypothetical protein [Cobetia sp. Dlab-2-AX]MCO7236750.1 hypothetical protein [Cobetia sp. Dlab-2-U]MDI4661962.1 hypothetical protein [Cobetia sp. BMC6]MDI5885833.1 hypothetical protein [Cobetia amphilecti]|tara:strand:+ start:17872 stop:18048 length:177 start_codon:yes stop_codon:yes gene_type:complete
MKYFDALFSLIAAVLVSALLPFEVEQGNRSTPQAPHERSILVIEGLLKESEDNASVDT